MSALNRKLFRDLWNIKGQAFAIALVITAGAATFVMALTTLGSLQVTRSTFYRDYRFADVFAMLKRAPEGLRSRLQAIPGVAQVETRVVAPVNLVVEGFSDPVTGLIHSLPDFSEPLLNGVFLRKGRLPESGRDDEIVAHESFTQAHGFEPGDRLHVIINGRRKRFTIVGIALAPEHVYAIRPGELFPDFTGFGVLWMRRKPLATAYDMDGAFNNVSFTLTAGAQEEEVIERVDDLLARYGGLGAFGRMDQVSHRFLSEEFRQLEQMATVYPVIFLGVAAFLLNVVISRLIRTEREQIATLKAFGYSNFAVGWHYAKLVLMITAIGIAGGIIAGTRFALGMAMMYMQFYRFPFLRFTIDPQIGVIAALVGAAAAMTGTLYSVRLAVRATPAEAMRPEPPATYRESVVERLGLKRWLAQPTRMIVRNLERRPVKSFLTSLGIAFAYAILMVGFFFNDAMAFLIRYQFSFAQRDDMTVTFVEPTSRRVLYDLLSLPGAEHGQVFRTVPVRLRSEHRTYRTSIQGVEPEGDLYRLLGEDLKTIEIPPSGMMLTGYLGDLLGVKPGDEISAEVLEGERPIRKVAVTGMAHQYLGVGAYMHIDALNRLMREGGAVSGVHLAADSLHEKEIYAALKEAPRVAGVTVARNAIKNLEDTMAEQLLTFAFFITLFAGSIAVSVVYNSARISLSERSRELASLRVLGFTRGEISYILLGELALLTLAAIPLGFLLGHALSLYIVEGIQTDLFRIPMVSSPKTYAFSATVVLVAAVISALMVRRKLDRLDLVEVLKTKE